MQIKIVALLEKRIRFDRVLQLQKAWQLILGVFGQRYLLAGPLCLRHLGLEVPLIQLKAYLGRNSA